MDELLRDLQRITQRHVQPASLCKCPTEKDPATSERAHETHPEKYTDQDRVLVKCSHGKALHERVRNPLPILGRKGGKSVAHAPMT
eukprot:4228167-Amphidinium_carterae.1